MPGNKSAYSNKGQTQKDKKQKSKDTGQKQKSKDSGQKQKTKDTGQKK